MTIFKTTDDAGMESIHDCPDDDIAKQAHLLHYGLLSINFITVEVVEGNVEPCFELACLDYIEQLKGETKKFTAKDE